MEQVYIQMATYGMSGSTLDFEGQLELSGKMGYTGVEFAGSNYGGMDAAQLAAALRQNRLTALSAHVSLNHVLRDLPLLKAVGAKYVIVASHYFTNREGVRALAEETNRIGKQVRAEGLWLGYHNHTAEFNIDDGKYLLEWLIEYTEPASVLFQLDVGWAAAAGIDVPAFMQKYKGRIRLIHANESDLVIGAEAPRDPATFRRDENGRPIWSEEEQAFRTIKNNADCPLGKGLLDWSKFYPLAQAAGVEAYIVERRHSYAPELETSLREDLAFLKNL